MKLERKWFAVTKYCLHWRHFDRAISPTAVRQITRDMKICEVILWNWVKKALAGKSLLNKIGIFWFIKFLSHFYLGPPRRQAKFDIANQNL